MDDESVRRYLMSMDTAAQAELLKDTLDPWAVALLAEHHGYANGDDLHRTYINMF
jgi:hypothetical protein